MAHEKQGNADAAIQAYRNYTRISSLSRTKRKIERRLYLLIDRRAAQLAKEALDKTVHKIIKAHRASELASGNATPNVVEQADVKPKSEPDDINPSKPTLSPLIKDLTINDVKEIIKSNSIKLGGKPGPKPDEFYFEGLSKQEGLEELVATYKSSIMSEYS